MRKFLLLTYHFPPSQAVAVHRMLGLVRYMPQYGWQPIVVAPPIVPGEPEDPELLKLIPAGSPVYRVPYPQGVLGRVARKLFPYGCWLPRAMRMCRALIREHRPEAIFTSSPPPAISRLGEHLKNSFGLPWLADYRDPSYANNPFRKVKIGKHSWEARLEMRTMRLADQIIANTPLMLEGVQAAYPQYAHKMTLITNGFDRAILPLTPPPPVVNQELTIIHAGELYMGRDPRPIFDALMQLRQEHPEQRWRFRLLGQSYCGGNLASELRQRGLEDMVSIEGQVDYAQALRSIRDAHILLVVHSPGVRQNIPAKLYEYIAAGRPILALAEPDGDIAWLLRSAGIPHRITPLKKNPSATEATGGVTGIKQALKELRCEIQAHPAPIFSSEKTNAFTREHMALLAAQCLDRCVPAPAANRLSWGNARQPC
jgi:glycosyltransferase involved in cell wall biosynthesis